MIKKLSLLLVMAVVVLLSLMLFNAYSTGSKQMTVTPIAGVSVDKLQASERLARAVQAQTITTTHANLPVAEYDKLQAHLAASFPLLNTSLKREVIGKHSLLFTWQGSETAAKPIAILAHQDVVPIAPGTEGDWQVPPFAGVIKDGFVWGRGAWDNKGNLMGLCEAVELLLKSGFKPKQTVYLFLGHDEEISGTEGAVAAVKWLQERKVQLSAVLDEGLLITDGIMKGIDVPVALIGIAEKGYMTVEVSAKATPGHSSMPPATAGQTAIGMLSQALVAMESQQLPAELRDFAKSTFETIAPEMNPLNRIVLSNLWLTKPLVLKQLQAANSTNAMLRTTTALTVVQAGNKDNVLPGVAEAKVNFRLLPGDSADKVLAHSEAVINNPKVAVKKSGAVSEASKVSSTDSPAFKAIAKTIRELHPKVVVAPGLMVAATDARHFEAVADAVYRFSPIYAKPEDLSRFHGTNERLSQDNYVQVIQFYHRFLQNMAD